MDKDQVLALMESSKSADERNANCDKVKAACGGYPDFWFGAIVLSGVADSVSARWGGSGGISVIEIG